MKRLPHVNWRMPLLLVVIVLTALAAGCSKSDKYKQAFMSQCALAKPMEDACSCTYDRMTAEVPVEAMAAMFEQGKRDPKVLKAISNALEICTAKYR